MKDTKYTKDEQGRIVKVEMNGASINVEWKNISAEYIQYTNFIISEVCQNRGIRGKK